MSASMVESEVDDGGRGSPPMQGWIPHVVRRSEERRIGKCGHEVLS